MTLSIGALGVLIAIMVVIDGRFRSEMSARTDPARAHTEIASLTEQVQQYASGAVSVVRSQANEHRPLTIMLAVGTALTFVLFRM